MHELSIAVGLCDQLEELARREGAHRVHRLVLEVGVLSNVVPELLAQAFEALRQEVPLVEHAELEIRAVPLRILCHDCGRESEPKMFRFLCPQCQSSVVETLHGEELLLRQVELEIEENEDDEHTPAARPGESAQVE